MARTSKKKQADDKRITFPAKIYSVGIYARISVDLNEKKNESVETQIDIAKAYIKQQNDMVIFECYIDIGKSGTDFEREGFERMMCDVRMRKIDCIVVKDLSRFGRNYIETGNYVEKIFPFMGVRFIAVTDHFDSINLAGENETMSMNLKNLVNEMYARDISAKIKSSRKNKREQGSYTGSRAAYGYLIEWVGDRRCLVREEKAASVVKKIYELFLDGKDRSEIIMWLYEQGVVCPKEYLKTGDVYCRDRRILKQWSSYTVKTILTNPVYIGCLVQGKTCGSNCGNQKRQRVSPEDWSFTENAHEAIISREMFFEVAEIFEKKSKYCTANGYQTIHRLEEDIFADVVYCGDCGSKIKRSTVVKPYSCNKKVRIYSYNCPKRNRMDVEKCASKLIMFDTLTALVKKAIRQEFALSSMRPKELIESNVKEAELQKAMWNKDLLSLETKIERLKKLGSEQYMQYRMGDLDETIFLREKNANAKKIETFQGQRAVLFERLRMIDTETSEKNHFLRMLVQGHEKAELTEDVIKTLISRIEIYADKRVKIIFTFQRKDVLKEEVQQNAEI